jgi:hypothetical protein
MRYAHPSNHLKRTQLKKWKVTEKQKQSKKVYFAASSYVIRYSIVFSYRLTQRKIKRVNYL